MTPDLAQLSLMNVGKGKRARTYWARSEKVGQGHKNIVQGHRNLGQGHKKLRKVIERLGKVIKRLGNVKGALRPARGLEFKV